MKNFFLILNLSILTCMSYADYTASLTAGFFYSDIDDLLDKGKAAWIIDTQASNFENFNLHLGNFLEKGAFIDSSERYFVLDVVDLDSSIAYLYSNINLDTSKFSENDTFAIVCWEGDSAFIKDDIRYLVFRDSSWQIPQSVGFVDFEAITEFAGGNIKEEALILNRTVIPEPSTFGVLLGGICIIIIVIRKKYSILC